MFRVCAYDNNQNWRNSQDLLQVKKNDRFRPAADVHRASKSLENEVDKLMIKPNFRRLILAQSWPRAACAYFNKNDTESFKEFCSPCGIDKKCTNDHWSWHGLWPSNDRKDSIIKKCSHEKFDESIFSTGELKDYRDLMEKKWRGIKHNQYNTYKAARYNNSYKNLWRHEWEKHGTCYGKSQTEYFRTAIELFQKFDLAKILNDHNINPDLDADKNFLEIHDAIKSYPDMNKHVAKIKCKVSSSIMYSTKQNHISNLLNVYIQIIF